MLASDIPEPLRHAAAGGCLVPFIGAGVSLHAETQGRPFPLGNELIREIKLVGDHSSNSLSEDEEAEIGRLLFEGKHLMAADFLRDRVPKYAMGDFLRRRLAGNNAKPGRLHRALLRLNAPLIMTTNYDSLLENACVEMLRENPAVATPEAGLDKVSWVLKGNRRSLGDAPLIFKLHGTVEDAGSIVFGEMDYARLIRNPGYRSILTAILITKVVLIMGHSFSDPDIFHILRESEQTGPHYIVFSHRETRAIESRQMRAYYGFEFIEIEHDDLPDFVESLAAFVPAPARDDADDA